MKRKAGLFVFTPILNNILFTKKSRLKPRAFLRFYFYYIAVFRLGVLLYASRASADDYRCRSKTVQIPLYSASGETKRTVAAFTCLCPFKYNYRITDEELCRLSRKFFPGSNTEFLCIRRFFLLRSSWTGRGCGNLGIPK